MKIKTRRIYGDKQLVCVRDDGTEIPVMILWRCRDRPGTYYKNDTVTNTFKTIAESKKYIMDNIEKFIG